jgi:hypothetical protein
MSNLISHLSFTRLKNLALCPLALKNYIETPSSSKAMDDGTLLDCIVFEPQKFDEKFFIVPDDAPKKPTKAQRNAKKPKPETLMQILKWDEIQAQVNGRIIVTSEEKEEAEYLKRCIENSSTVVYNGLMVPFDGQIGFNFQAETKFFYNGFFHKGIKDADGYDRNGNRVIWDLKRMGARSGESLVRSQIRNNKYDLQAAIYCHEFDSVNEPVRYYIIAVDNDGYVTPFEVTKDARNKARIEWNMLVKAAHRCNMEGLDAGPEFWADGNGFFYF